MGLKLRPYHPPEGRYGCLYAVPIGRAAGLDSRKGCDVEGHGIHLTDLMDMNKGYFG